MLGKERVGEGGRGREKESRRRWEGEREGQLRPDILLHTITFTKSSHSQHRWLCWSENAWVHLLPQKTVPAALPGVTLLSFLLSMRTIRLTLVRRGLFGAGTSVWVWRGSARVWGGGVWVCGMSVFGDGTLISWRGSVFRRWCRTATCLGLLTISGRSRVLL